MRLRTLLLMSTALIPLAGTSAYAGPEGAQVVGGSANVQGQGTANVVVNQFSDKAIINWRMFDIGVGEKTTFRQPDSNSIALNRVTGGMGPSQILGSLEANGKVFVVNRDGIIFGAGAVINTAGFLATTSDIRNQDFMAGRFNFNIPGRGDASIVNQGTITATSGGFAALVAPGVRNSGTITANLGTVALGAGNLFTLDFYGDKLITLGVGDQIASQVKDVATGKPLSALVKNEGVLRASGGRVELTAAAARQVVDSVINTSGVIEANSVGVKNGQIVLSAATADTKGDAPAQRVRVSGAMSAAGQQKGTKGGKIVVTGEHIELRGAAIDASGRAGGGKVLVGGDWGGGKPNKDGVNNQSAALEPTAIPNATSVSMDAASSIDASARDSGHGGKVVLWSDGTTTFAGTILALGGKEFGNGGFVETSGKGTLDATGNVNAGQGGTWLLDPANITVDTALALSISNSLNGGSNVTQQTATTGAGDGDIIFNSGVRIEWNTSATLTLIAFRNIQFNDGAFGPGPAFLTGNIVNTGSGNLVMRADSTGTGVGTLIMTPFTNPTRVNWTNSTGNISLYYNPTVFGTQNNFGPPANGNIQVASPSQLTQYMLVNNTTQLGAIGSSPTEKYAIGPAAFDATGFTGINTLSFSGVLTGNGGVGINSAITSLSAPLFLGIAANGSVRDLNFSGVNITGGTSSTLGTVSQFSSGSISNINVTSGSITGGAASVVGGIVATNSGTITNVQSAATTSGGNGALVGGIAGSNTATITNAAVSGGVSGTANGTLLGGIAGTNDGTITGASVGSITINAGSFLDLAAGGITGINNGIINGNSQSNANINVGAGSTIGPNYAGGIAGVNAGTIANVTAGGSLAGGTNSFVGGIAGQNGGDNIGAGPGSTGTNYGPGTIQSASTTSAVSGNDKVGGLVGANQVGSSITSSSATGNVSGTATSAIIGGLAGQNEGAISNSSVSNNTVGGTANQAGGFAGKNTGSITNAQTTNVTVSGLYSFGGGLVGLNQGTIADSSSSGAVNRTAVGLSAQFGGLVGQNAAGASITNSSSSATMSGGAGTLGGLVGFNDGSVAGSNASGSVTAGVNSYAGGLVGQNRSSITSSTASGNVTGLGGSIVGGLVGFNDTAGSIGGNSSASGAVTGPNMAGGLTGQNAGTIASSSASGDVSGTGTSSIIASLGGLVGQNTASGQIAGSTATGNVTTNGYARAGGLIGDNSANLSNLSASNDVTGSGMMVMLGGLVGINQGGATLTNTQAHGDVSWSGAASGSGVTAFVGGLVGQNLGTITGSSTPAIDQACSSGQSCATGAVSGADRAAVGGLVGQNFFPLTGPNPVLGVIANSFATGAVSATDGTANRGVALGGLVGDTAGPISGSHARGNVTGGDYTVAGGLVGRTTWLIGTPFTITNSRARGNVTVGDNSFAGGLIGSQQCDDCTVSNSGAFGSVSAGNASVAGGFIGSTEGTIANATADGPVTAGGNSVAGGLIGAVTDGSSTVSGSHAFGTVTSTGANSIVGGLVGLGTGLISNSQATGAVNVTSDSYAGGLVGINIARIETSAASGAVTASGSDSVIGGLVGMNAGAISQSTASGAVNGGDGTVGGGLVGANVLFENAPPANFPLAAITQSSSTGAVTGGSGSTLGGLIGANGGSISGLSSSSTVTGGDASTVGGLVGLNAGPSFTPALPSALAPLLAQFSFSISTDGGTISNSSANGVVSAGFAAIMGGLVGENPGTISGSSANASFSGGEFGTAGGLVGINSGAISNSQATGAINLATALTLGGLVGQNDFDGTISNSSASNTVTGASFAIGGLAGSNDGAISGSTATGNVTGGPGSFTGGLVGFNSGTIASSTSSGTVTAGTGAFLGGIAGANDGTISDSSSTSTVIADPSTAGGLVGYNLGTIENSHASGAVSGDDGSFVGGLVGFNILGTIQNSYSVSNVSVGAGGMAGGLVAGNYGSITQSFATGTVTGGDNSYVGGLAAYNYGDNSVPGVQIGQINQSYATGAVTGGANSVVGGLVAENAGSLDQTYATGLVTAGANSVTGGLVASNNFTIPNVPGNPNVPSGGGAPGTATNSYWDTTTTGQSQSAGGTGLSTAQFTSALPSGFSPAAWSTGSGTYPFLTGQPNPLPVPGNPANNPGNPNNPPPTGNPNNPPPTDNPNNPPPTDNPNNPDRPDQPTNVPQNSPQVNVTASLTNDQFADRKQDNVIDTTQSSGPSGGSSSGSSSSGSGSQSGGTAPGNAGRPPGNVVPPAGLGPLPSGMPPANETRFASNEVVMQLGLNLTPDQVAALASQFGLEVISSQNFGLLGRTAYRFRITGGRSVREVIAGLQSRGATISAQPSYTFSLDQGSASPATQGDAAQYIVTKLGLVEAHGIATGKGVKVAVIDSEIDAQHPDLQGVVAGTYDALPSDDQTPHAHGTGMAGAIGSHQRLLGIAPGARIYGVRAFGVSQTGAQGTSMNIVKGLEWAVQQGAQIINMSFAGPRDPILEQAIKALKDRGIILVAAAGNAGPKSPPLFPGADANVIAVSATDQDDKTYKNANRGKQVSIAAPGVDILVPAPEGGYQLTTGTSVAAAHISGVVALMLERNPQLTANDVRRILEQTARKLPQGRNEIGAGLVDPAQALAKSGPKQAEAR